MSARYLIAASVAAVVAMFGTTVPAAATGVNSAVAVDDGVTIADSLFAIEANRVGIVNRLLVEYSDALAASGVSPPDFRNALMSLRADQLLAASLVSSFTDVTAILAQPAASALVQQRFVALTPSSPVSLEDLPPADAYVIRDGAALHIVSASEVPLGRHDVMVVGYLAANKRGISELATVSTEQPEAVQNAAQAKPVATITLKDGTGSGSNSWIGYTAGNNLATGSGSAVAAGTYNWASGQNAFVGAGESNQAAGISSLVMGGFDNHAMVIDSTVVAGAGNRTYGARSVVVGGGYNLASGQWSFIGGGGRQTGTGSAGNSVQDNVVSQDWSAIAGGIGNRVSGNYAFVGGGAYNIASNNGAVVVGGNNGLVGQGNTASGLNSFVGAGFLNVASGPYSAIFAGHESTASGAGAVVLGGNGPGPGLGNLASGQSALVTTGFSNTASGVFSSVLSGHDSVASGLGSTAIGISNTASGAGSIAIGTQAKTETAGQVTHAGSFVFSDGSSGNYRSTGLHTFNVLATGGAQIVTAATNTSGEAVPTAGVTISAGSGSWTSLSDRAAKRDLLAADPEGVLGKVAALPVYTWRYITEVSGALHMGPTAQDFRAAFGLGDSDRSITTVDADGVALAAIKGLKQELDRKDAQIERLDRELQLIKGKLDLH